MSEQLSTAAKALLMASMLADDRLISNNGKGFLKELILRRDERIEQVMALFDQQSSEAEGSVIDELTKLIDSEAHLLYTELFKNCTLEDGKTLSKKEREDGDLKEDKSLIYGEVAFFSFAAILRKINPEPGTVFYDLGSGTGKALFVARLTCDFGRCTGIEILEGLSAASAAITDQFSSTYREYLCASQPQEVTVHQGSFLEFDWSDGDVVFANSTCYDDELMLKMTAQASRLKPGAYVITFTKGLESPDFEVLFRKRYDMSWGLATVYIHRRLREDGTSVIESQLDPTDADEEDLYDEDGDDENETEDQNEYDEDDEDGGEEDAEGNVYDGGQGAQEVEGRLGQKESTGRPLESSVYTFQPNTTVSRVSAMYAPNHLSSPQDAALMRRKRAHQ